MAKNKCDKRVVTHEVKALLKRIENGETMAAKVLAEHLQENNLPLAKKINNIVARWVGNVSYWEKADMAGSRRRQSKHEIIAVWNRVTLRKILRAFGPVTTSTGRKPVPADKSVMDSVERLRELRTRIKRLETAVEKRSKRIARDAEKAGLLERVAHHLHRGSAIGDTVSSYGRRVVIVGERPRSSYFEVIVIQKPGEETDGGVPS